MSLTALAEDHRQPPPPTDLLDRVEGHIRRRTFGKVRFLDVSSDAHGRVVVRGLAPTYYAKQLAIQAAAELLAPADHAFDVLIEVP